MPSSPYHQPSDLTLLDQPPFSPRQNSQVGQLCQGWAASSAERQSNGKSEAAQKNSCASSALRIPVSKDNREQDPFAVSHPGPGRSVHPWSGIGLRGSPAAHRQQTGRALPSAEPTGSSSTYPPVSAAPGARTDVHCWTWTLLRAHLLAGPGTCGVCLTVSQPAFSLPRNRHFFEEIINYFQCFQLVTCRWKRRQTRKNLVSVFSVLGISQCPATFTVPVRSLGWMDRQKDSSLSLHLYSSLPIFSPRSIINLRNPFYLIG